MAYQSHQPKHSVNVLCIAALVGILRSEKVITDRHMKQIFPEAENMKSCLNCDQFGIGCGDCEVSEDD